MYWQISLQQVFFSLLLVFILGGKQIWNCFSRHMKIMKMEMGGGGDLKCPPKPPSCFVALLPLDVLFSKFFSSFGSSLKVAGSMPSTLLKMNFFIGIFQEFWPQISKHIFQSTSQWLFLCLFCIFFLLTQRFLLSVLVSLNFLWVCWKPPKFCKWKFLKSWILIFES